MGYCLLVKVWVKVLVKTSKKIISKYSQKLLDHANMLQMHLEVLKESKS